LFRALRSFDNLHETGGCWSLADKLTRLNVNEQSTVAGLTNSSEDHDLAIYSIEGSTAALDAFKPEPPDAVASDGRSGDPSPVSLATLATAGIVLDANDVVAIGQALCQAFIGTQHRRRLRLSPEPGETDPLPIDLDSIFIDASGRVKLDIGALQDEAATIHALGKVLSDMLPSESRSFLKTKIMAKALASPPQFTTIDEMSQAFAALSRPDRRDLVKAIYDLWQREGSKTTVRASFELPAPIAQSVEVEPPAPTITALGDEAPPAEELTSSEPAQRAKYRRLVLVSAVIAASLATLGIGAWLVVTRSRVAPVAATVQPATPPVEALEPTMASPFDSAEAAADATIVISPRATPTVAGPAAESSQASILSRVQKRTATVPVGIPTGRLPIADPTPMIATSLDVSVRPLSPANAPSKTSTSNFDPKTSVPIQSTASLSHSTADFAPVEADAQPIYGKDDLEVTPPRPIVPRLLAGLHPSSPKVRFDALTIAVVVNPDGSVDSVRGLVAPENISEVLLLTEALSAVKSWRFSPATRDGAPVKYRQIVPIGTLTRATP
jgi:hypothetical protein